MNEELREKLRQALRDVINEIDRKRFDQEPAYVCALLAKLDGKKLFINPEQVIFRSTIVSDRGPGSAESKYGADFAITLEIRHDNGTIFQKAIIGQAKKGVISSGNGKLPTALSHQVEKMGKYTKHIVIMETPDGDLIAPRIRMQGTDTDNLEKKTHSFEDYIIDFFIKCTHGDLRADFVDAVSTSTLDRLNILIGTTKTL